MVHTRIHCGLFVVSRDSAVEKGGGIKFQIRMEVKLRNDMFSIRPASTICVLVLWRFPVIQDSVGSSVVDVLKTAPKVSLIFLPILVLSAAIFARVVVFWWV